MRRAAGIIAFSLLFVLAGGACAAPEVKAADYQPGMVITGDQEAPLVLFVVPWHEPQVPEVPDADLQPVLPKVLDDDFGILRRSRAGSGASAGASGGDR